MLSFPSVDLLDGLLQYSFTCATATKSLIHVASFIPSHKRPELCASIIAAGAFLAPDPSLRKLGLVIQESVRVSAPKHIEIDNTCTRDIQLIQAGVIALNIALWSGNSRKMELAESFFQPWATMVRRAVS